MSPRVIVCLGATAAKALMGPAIRVTQARGQVLERGGRAVVATWHPSAVLRAAADPEQARVIFDQLTDDLRTAAGFARRSTRR